MEDPTDNARSESVSSVMTTLATFLRAVCDRGVFADASWVKPRPKPDGEALVLRSGGDDHYFHLTNGEIIAAANDQARLDLVRDAVLTWAISTWKGYAYTATPSLASALEGRRDQSDDDLWRCAGAIMDGRDCTIRVGRRGDSFCVYHRELTSKAW